MGSSSNSLHEVKDISKYIEFLGQNLDSDNYGEYISLLEDCANSGDLNCILQLSDIYKFGNAFTEPNLTSALETLKVAFANFNNPKIAAEIAEIYWIWIQDEDNEDYNNREAVKWYEIAAKLGDAESCERLGRWHNFGIYIDENLDKAIRYHELAIGYGSKSSHHELAKLYLDNFTDQIYIDKAIKLLIEGSIKNDEVSQYTYSVFLDEGEIVKQDKKESLMWLEKSALSGNSTAQLRIANKYLSGDFLDKNIHEAFVWLERAAENHNQEAQLQLHACYLIGSGVEKNMTQALAWLLIGLRNDRNHNYPEILNIFTPICSRLIETMPKNHIEKAKKITDNFIQDHSHRYTDAIRNLKI